jgi:hypothetical protein
MLHKLFVAPLSSALRGRRSRLLMEDYSQPRGIPDNAEQQDALG